MKRGCKALQGVCGAARGCEGLCGAARGCTVLRGAAKGLQGAARGCEGLCGAAGGCEGLREAAGHLRCGAALLVSEDEIDPAVQHLGANLALERGAHLARELAWRAVRPRR